MIFGAKPYGNIIADGLVLNLDATNPASYPGTGTTWYDRSGYNNNGTLTNGPIYFQQRGRGGFVFDGVDDRVECGNANIVPNSWTVNCWLVHTKPTGTSIFVARTGTSPNYDQNLVLGWSTSSAFDNRFYVSGKTTTGVYYSSCSSSFNPVTGSVYNLAGCFDSSTTTLSLYVNGVINNTKVVGALFTTGSNLPIQIGCSDGTSPGNFAKGNIYSVQIYNRALTAQEVLQNYNALKSRFV
jgi:hypothetical protein